MKRIRWQGFCSVGLLPLSDGRTIVTRYERRALYRTFSTLIVHRPVDSLPCDRLGMCVAVERAMRIVTNPMG